MPLLRLAIADANQQYLNRLKDVLSEYKDIKIATFSDIDSLRADIERRKYHVLVFDPSMYSPSISLDDVQVAIVLSGENRVPRECERLPKVRKFQRIDAIYHGILEICSSQMTDFDRGGRSGIASVVSFYSPVGGSGKTTLSLAAAAKLSMVGNRVFYLNLEFFPSDGCYLPQMGTLSLSALLANLSQNGNHTMYMQSGLQAKADNFYYLNHFDSPNDYSAMSAKELTDLISLLQKSGSFDVIIVDMSSTFDDKTSQVWSLSDLVVLVEQNDAIGITKMASFVSQTHIIEEFGDKMKRLLNFDTGRGSGVQSDLPIIGRISRKMSADSGALIGSIANSPEAEFARLLME